MKFGIIRTSCKPVLPEHQNPTVVTDRLLGTLEHVNFVSLNSLEDLKALSEQYDEELVVDFKRYIEMGQIEVFDDYR